ncbi:hypothetical protein SAMN04489765_3125 [Tsukamurella pulmonis]|uniref:Uncharacterized protein n=1 Tax=Tsukamurella pulmonis TaxID=47312 RepID=A0A1H1G5G9_9ACTN|nr:hypothetical protein [Tsukamurella pulmonis]SDR08502.1 hypothetical protein SAMN04489765_3125 [Tsukamurella pulmonis]SUP17830.1 Uncharacterised protein [Tsukamurella pulmonis]
MNATLTPPDLRELRDELFAFGGDTAKGYSTEADVLVNQTADGISLEQIWDEASAAMSMWNKQRSSLASLISYSTTDPASAIPQTIGGDKFELASEFGEPEGLRAEPNALILGNTFADHDLASRFSWKFLRSATASQVRSVVDRAFEADNRLVSGTILRRLFDPTQEVNEYGSNCFGLYNGDGTVPPSFSGQNFNGTDSHYLVSSNTDVDPMDIVDAVNKVRDKGFGTTPNARLVVLAHPHEADQMREWRAGGEYNGIVSRWDFVPSSNSPAYLAAQNVVGEVAPGEFHGVECIGSYGPTWILPSYWVPQGYLAVIASGGPGSSVNPIAFREHQNPAYRGLRMIPGNGPYPLQDSYFQRSFGVGTRYRGAACVIQVKASGNYDIPEWEWS